VLQGHATLKSGSLGGFGFFSRIPTIWMSIHMFWRSQNPNMHSKKPFNIHIFLYLPKVVLQLGAPLFRFSCISRSPLDRNIFRAHNLQGLKRKLSPSTCRKQFQKILIWDKVIGTDRVKNTFVTLGASLKSSDLSDLNY
jgi:hypothetical protein